MTSQNDVIKNLRSCLVSSKGGVKLDDLMRDYHTITGERLRFKDFGYSSIENFVRNIPDVTLIRKNGELYVEAAPSKNTAHLTKLVSRQKVKRQIRSQPQKRNPPRQMSSFSVNYNYVNNSLQPKRNNYVSSPHFFTTSSPGTSNLYTDFTRPRPLMETIVQHPLSRNPNPNLIQIIPPSSPTKRLKNGVTNINVTTMNQSHNYKAMHDLKGKVLNDNTTVSSVINQKPKTQKIELQHSKLNERLRPVPETSPLPNVNFNNDRTSAPVQRTNFNVSQISDLRKQLEIRANALNLPSPIYKLYSQKEKNSTKITIYASVKIGVHTFNTFPDEASSEEEAENIAARLALVNLAKESSSSEVTTADAELIKERIWNIITRHHGGVFMHLLPEFYNEQYNETLPDDWQTIIEKCRNINQEKGVGNYTILCCSSSNSKPSENNFASYENVSENTFPSNEKIQLSPIGPAVPDTLPVPTATIWQVFATYVVSTVEIWVRLGDVNDEFVDMTNEMTSHYYQINKSAPLEACVVDDFYAVFENDYWHRVQCTEFNNETKIATVFFIDEGYEGDYQSNVLYPLDKKFCSLPCQAVRLALQGLKDFRDCSEIVPDIENHLIVDQLFNVTVHGTDSDENGVYYIVTFYDTSKENEDVDINEVLFKKITHDMADALKIHKGKSMQLYITHIDDCGNIFAQVNSFAKTILSSEMSQMSLNSGIKVTNINFTKTYLVEYNSQWFRVKVIDIHNDHEITVSLIDVGRNIVIPRKNLFHINKLSMALRYLPAQAMQIFLNKIDPLMYNRKLVTRFRELVSDTDLLTADVVEISTSGVPIVDISKRIEPNNMLVLINSSLIYDDKLSRSNTEDKNNNKTKKRFERKSSSRAIESVIKLNPPKIPDIGQYFEVRVSLVAHPGHFIVQPLEDAQKLKELSIELQNYYKENNSLPLESIGEGKLYAGKFCDKWYRVYVTDIISNNDVSVYFCDYGNVMIIHRNDLQPLKNQFLKLPYQAIKAKLIGIEPVNRDWTVIDCLKFKELVFEKDFCSSIVESVFDDLSPVNGTMLGVRLIDVSTPEDIYIDDLLVEEKRAKYTRNFKNLSSS
ncbi:hypothetical protein PUN28_017578 [Cardiocondyla obscurior]|uniref:Tudor domain-containing protein 7 n=1 Tax=Cardiocondyla obscurior TaxID=286306 RepID=A0AAW2ENI5_9HYME